MSNQRAFTLIELLIVVAIIAILAAIAVPNFLEAQTRSKVSRAKADLRAVQLALESYAVDNNTYPYTESIGPTIWLPAGGFPRSNATARPGGLTSPVAYITTLPNDAFKHSDTDPATGLPNFVDAPLYYERAGFGYTDGNQLVDKHSFVPADAVGNQSLVGTGADTQVRDPRQTPAAYILYSIGPDLTPLLVDNSTGNIVSRSRWNLNNRYDPTNGTVSPGNILRLPGGQSFP
ncbi:MAG: prepilin-type N-terminal cleavage/methylation domain-containing protein [Candidatus Sumerlaeia bacterium]|nr:prepilin-type N-terminal cleavage/methylation domain-containing protein [Candidatus Sumerlaeia bacterium]